MNKLLAAIIVFSIASTLFLSGCVDSKDDATDDDATDDGTGDDVTGNGDGDVIPAGKTCSSSDAQIVENIDSNLAGWVAANDYADGEIKPIFESTGRDHTWEEMDTDNIHFKFPLLAEGEVGKLFTHHKPTGSSEYVTYMLQDFEFYGPTRPASAHSSGVKYGMLLYKTSEMVESVEVDESGGMVKVIEKEGISFDLEGYKVYSYTEKEGIAGGTLYINDAEDERGCEEGCYSADLIFVGCDGNVLQLTTSSSGFTIDDEEWVMYMEFSKNTMKELASAIK